MREIDEVPSRKVNFSRLVDFHAIVEVFEVVGAEELHSDDGENEQYDEQDEGEMSEITERPADDSDQLV